MHHLDVDYALEGQFDPRDAFGSHSDMDHVYNTPRAWMIERYFNPLDETWEGPDADLTPSSDDIPWCRQPDHKITIEDIDYALAMHYQGTKFDPYGKLGTEATRHLYRPAGINRTCECCILQVRPYAPAACRSVQWTAFGSGPFNTAIALYANVKAVPAYLDTPEKVRTDSFYWTNRLVAALADPEYFENFEALSSYQQQTLAAGYASLRETDAALEQLAKEGKADLSAMDDAAAIKVMEEANQALCDLVQEANDDLLATTLFNRSLAMRNAFGSNDH